MVYNSCAHLFHVIPVALFSTILRLSELYLSGHKKLKEEQVLLANSILIFSAVIISSQLHIFQADQK